ncbi:hypothetical protein [Novosphingobium terrae]|uniref:hypothetical protein n=1 Tax=Novosphingobium terrae TaxID=2726189 RepID=UPI0019825DD6|nr:hypothetical protein [Novosphingobium terrae]
MGEIIVCAPNQDRHRMRPLSGDYTMRVGLPKAQVDLGGGKSLGVAMEPGATQNGAVSNRVMLKGSIKF